MCLPVGSFDCLLSWTLLIVDVLGVQDRGGAPKQPVLVGGRDPDPEGEQPLPHFGSLCIVVLTTAVLFWAAFFVMPSIGLILSRSAAWHAYLAFWSPFDFNVLSLLILGLPSSRMLLQCT